MSAAIFSSRAVAWLIGICALSLLVGGLLGALGTDLTGQRSFGADAFSRSALGHKAFVRWLRELQVPVHLSLDQASVAAQRGTMLVVAEPILSGPDDSQLELWHALLEYFDNILIVLPKWYGASDPRRPHWILAPFPTQEQRVQGVMAALEIEATVVRLEEEQLPHWISISSEYPPPELHRAQLLQSDEMVPLWVAEEGVLAAYWTPRYDTKKRVVVLSDPDLLSNHGLAKGGNAGHMLSIIRQLGGVEGGVVIDETLHGFSAPRSIWRGVFRFPLSLVLSQVLLTAAVLVWLAVGRFGAPLPPPPALEPGQGYLIDNTANLLHMGGHGPAILRRYHEAIVQAVARDLHLDGRLAPAEVRQRLLRIGQARGVAVDLEKVEAELRQVTADGAVRSKQLLEIAGEIHRWQREMTHGL